MPEPTAKPPRKPRTRSGWSPERRAKHLAAMRRWKPWEKSTGPKTATGKSKSRLNAYKHGIHSAANLRLRAALAAHGRFLSDVHRYVRARNAALKLGLTVDDAALWRQICAESAKREAPVKKHAERTIEIRPALRPMRPLIPPSVRAWRRTNRPNHCIFEKAAL